MEVFSRGMRQLLKNNRLRVWWALEQSEVATMRALCLILLLEFLTGCNTMGQVPNGREATLSIS